MITYCTFDDVLVVYRNEEHVSTRNALRLVRETIPSVERRQLYVPCESRTQRASKSFLHLTTARLRLRRPYAGNSLKEKSW